MGSLFGRPRRARIAVIGVSLALLAMMLPVQAFGASTDGVGNGVYAVQVDSDGAWVTVGTLSFGHEYTTKGIVLPGDYDRVRLAQSGGTAAQIDSVALAGAAPVAVTGSEDALALTKVAGADNDVTNVFGSAVTLAFPAMGSKLEVTARIQGDISGAYPFEYPPENMLQTVSADSAFYTYTAGRATTVDTAADPFMAVLSKPDTGHPAGYTYAWVADDADHLFVTLDFTSDNTMDADEDYATVHVKTATGVKAFTVSVADSTWGNVVFTYTDTVSYQHKVYSFAIPWSEVGGRADTVGVAFTAYGTAAVMPIPVHRPVYRLYNGVTGTHLYTISDAEVAHIQATWPTVFAYEGPAFSAVSESMLPPDPALQAYRVPLYRFYNLRTGSHFYTMSETEKAFVQANYPTILRYEGVAFEVMSGNPGMGPFRPVYRFYNKINGSHFYTISETERSLVQLLWSDIYRFEGIGFWAFSYGFSG